MRTGLNTALDPTRRSNDAQEFEGFLRRKIVGQNDAIGRSACEPSLEHVEVQEKGLNLAGRRNVAVVNAAEHLEEVKGYFE